MAAAVPASGEIAHSATSTVAQASLLSNVRGESGEHTSSVDEASSIDASPASGGEGRGASFAMASSSRRGAEASSSEGTPRMSTTTPHEAKAIADPNAIAARRIRSVTVASGALASIDKIGHAYA